MGTNSEHELQNILCNWPTGTLKGFELRREEAKYRDTFVTTVIQQFPSFISNVLYIFYFFFS